MKKHVGLYVLFSVFWIFTASGCAHGLDGVRQALTDAEKVETQAIKSLEQYDAQHQKEIVAKAKTQEEAHLALEAYRKARGHIIQVLNDAAAVIAVGATLIPLIERGIKHNSDLNAWLVDLFNAGLKVRQALADFGLRVGA